MWYPGKKSKMLKLKMEINQTIQGFSPMNSPSPQHTLKRRRREEEEDDNDEDDDDDEGKRRRRSRRK